MSQALAIAVAADADATFAPSDWQRELREAYRSPQELADAGFVLPQHVYTNDAFCFRVPRSYAQLFARDDLAGCPLFRQALPSARESDPTLPAWARALSQRGCGRDAPWQADAIGDVACLAAPRLTHRYAHRAILHTSFACALYCRFCFRKHEMAEQEPALYRGPFAPALAYLRAHKEITEVILTGGDPLSLSDHALQKLLAELNDIAHVRVVRLHSRMLGVLPTRITHALVQMLGHLDKQIVVVAHIAHPRELSPAARDALVRLRRAGVVTMHQMVLLRGINDDVETLFALYSELYALGCVPHYLHHPDWTPHTFGFRVSIAQGRALIAGLAGRLSGPAVPTYVLDVPGGHGKVRLCDAGVTQMPGALDSGEDAQLTGQLWQVRVPHTRRAKPDAPLVYVDLAWR